MPRAPCPRARPGAAPVRLTLPKTALSDSWMKGLSKRGEDLSPCHHAGGAARRLAQARPRRAFSTSAPLQDQGKSGSPSPWWEQDLSTLSSPTTCPPWRTWTRNSRSESSIVSDKVTRRAFRCGSSDGLETGQLGHGAWGEGTAGLGKTGTATPLPNFEVVGEMCGMVILGTTTGGRSPEGFPFTLIRGGDPEATAISVFPHEHRPCPPDAGS